jgi:uncharacterized phage protein (TIGR02220 family)
VPDRIIRAGILTSEAVNSLSWQAEVFYRRVMSVVDDFGRYDGRPSVLRAALYALKIDRVSEPDIGKWIGECQEAGLVRMYTVDGKPYLELSKFGQKIRTLKSKWPDPPADVGNCQQMLADVPVVVDVVVVDKKTLSGKPDPVPKPKLNGYSHQAKEVLDFLNEKTGRQYRPVPVNLELIAARLKDGATVQDCRQIIAKKCRDWNNNPDMEQYLRPATLFNRTKFAQYQGEIVNPAEVKNGSLS